MARDSDIMNSAEEEVVKVLKICDANKDFDLPQNYQNAIDCLVQCEYLINNLQEQLASKDEQIASLEEKLVRMSFELASSKALQDEQLHQFKRSISSIENSSVDDDNRCATSSQQQQQQIVKTFQEGQATVNVNYASVGLSQSRNSPRLHNPRPMLSPPWSVRDSRQPCEVDTTAWPQAINEKFDPAHPVGLRDPEPRQCSSFRLPRLAQRMSSSKIDDATSWMTSDNSAKKYIFSNTSSGLIRNYSAGNLDRAKEILPSDRTSSLFTNHSSPSTNGMRQRAATPNNGPTAPTRRLTMQHASRPSSLDNSFTPRTRRLSNFGQFILGLNKNDKTTEKEAANEQTMNDQDDPPSRRGSSRSHIQGVVFPISSDDCLIGLCQDAVIESCPSRSNNGNNNRGRSPSVNRGRSPSVNANANVEWPEFR